MADYSIKANDRLPSIRATLSTGGTAIDLTTATGVSFIMRRDGDPAPKVNSPAVVVDAVSGIVRYDWAAGDTSDPGTYKAEWEIVWADGKTQTAPTLTYHEIDVLADLDEAS